MVKVVQQINRHRRKVCGSHFTPNTYDFEEGDLIGKVKGQAKEVKSLKGARWVTAMLGFTKGESIFLVMRLQVFIL